MKRLLMIAGMLILTLAWISPAQSQNDSARMKMRQELSKLMKEKLVEKVGLSASTADQFMTKLEENGSKVRTLMKEKREIMDDIDLDPGAADVESKLDRSLDIDIMIAELKKEFKTELRQFMSAQEIAKTMKFRKKFDRELRQEIRKKRGGDQDFRGPRGKMNPDGPFGPGGPPDDDMPPPPPPDEF